LIVYLDTSVLLARLFAEDRSPPDAFWNQRLASSRLLEYEVLNRVHARGAWLSHGEAARSLLDRVSLVEMAPQVLDRALSPFPQPVRTLDALHLATLAFLQLQGLEMRLATYDLRLAAAAGGMGLVLAAC